MAAIILRNILIPQTANVLANGLDSFLTDMKTHSINGKIYQQEVHLSDDSQQFAQIVVPCTVAQDAIIVSTAIPALATAIGSGTLFSWNSNAAI